MQVEMLHRMAPGGGRGMLSIGQSKAKIYEADPATRGTFADVAGVDEAVEETHAQSATGRDGRIRCQQRGRPGGRHTGASDDLEKASKIVREMLTTYGMSKQLPNLSLVEGGQNGFLGQAPRSLPHSAAIEQAIGEEMLQILRTGYDDAKSLLNARRAQLESLAQRLLSQEKIDEQDLIEVLGPRPTG